MKLPKVKDKIKRQFQKLQEKSIKSCIGAQHKPYRPRESKVIYWKCQKEKKKKQKTPANSTIFSKDIIAIMKTHESIIPIEINA